MHDSRTLYGDYRSVAILFRRMLSGDLAEYLERLQAL